MRTKEELSRLLIAAVTKDYVEEVEALIKEGIDVNAKDNDEETALMFASYWGHTGIVKLLLKNGADVSINAESKHSKATALSLASEKGRIEIVKLLLKNGADVNAKSECGNTALMLASGRGHAEVVAMLKENGATE